MGKPWVINKATPSQVAVGDFVYAVLWAKSDVADEGFWCQRPSVRKAYRIRYPFVATRRVALVARTRVRVANPIGPALDVEYFTDKVSAVRGEIEATIGGMHREFLRVISRNSRSDFYAKAKIAKAAAEDVGRLMRLERKLMRDSWMETPVFPRAVSKYDAAKSGVSFSDDEDCFRSLNMEDGMEATDGG